MKERLRWKRATLDGLTESQEHRMHRQGIPKEVFHLAAPARQPGARVRPTFVAEVVGRAAEGVDPRQVPANLRCQEPRSDREVLVVSRRERSAMPVGGFQLTASNCHNPAVLRRTAPK